MCKNTEFHVNNTDSILFLMGNRLEGWAEYPILKIALEEFLNGVHLSSYSACQNV